MHCVWEHWCRASAIGPRYMVLKAFTTSVVSRALGSDGLPAPAGARPTPPAPTAGSDRARARPPASSGASRSGEWASPAPARTGPPPGRGTIRATMSSWARCKVWATNSQPPLTPTPDWRGAISFPAETEVTLETARPSRRMGTLPMVTGRTPPPSLGRSTMRPTFHLVGSPPLPAKM